MPTQKRIKRGEKRSVVRDKKEFCQAAGASQASDKWNQTVNTLQEAGGSTQAPPPPPPHSQLPHRHSFLGCPTMGGDTD